MNGNGRPSGVGVPASSAAMSTRSDVAIFRDPPPHSAHGHSHAHPASTPRPPPAHPTQRALPDVPAQSTQPPPPGPSYLELLAPPSQPPRTKSQDKARTSAIVDSSAFDYALLSDRAARQQQRQVTPQATPHRKRQRINGDRYAENLDGVCNECSTDVIFRFIPTRSGRDLQSGFRLIQEPEPATPARQRRRVPRVPTQRSEWSHVYRGMVRF